MDAMKSAREVVDSWWDSDDDDVVLIELLQQAREDGARWALEQVDALDQLEHFGDINPADVRKVAP
jgi:hypothetical protein